MKDLQKIRQTIDDIDDCMASLFAERMHAAAKAHACKSASGLPLCDPEREAAVVAAWQKRLPDDLAPYGETLARCLLDLSKQYQSRLAGTEENA